MGSVHACATIRGKSVLVGVYQFRKKKHTLMLNCQVQSPKDKVQEEKRTATLWFLTIKLN